MEHNIPTVKPASPVDATADANSLHKAMTEMGTDEEALIKILCYRTSSQRNAIVHAYKSIYRKNLRCCLQRQLGGKFENLMVTLCIPTFMAHEVHEAILGLGTTEKMLTEILCSATNHEIKEMRAAYQSFYVNTMDEDIGGETSGTFKSLLVSLSKGERKEDEDVDYEKAKETAETLYLAGEARMGTDDDTFISILTTNSFAQLRQIMIEYGTKHSHTLEEAIDRKFSYNVEKALLAILECAKNRHAFFARRLRLAIQGLGINDWDLICIIVGRCDIDLGNIKQEYEKIFKKSLQADISEETSGDYRKALLALVG